MGKRFTEEEKARIEQLNREGKNHRTIGEQLGYSRMQIKEYFHRLYKKERAAINLTPAKRKGRPCKMPLTKENEMELRVMELECENELLRSFLRAAGRR